MPVMRQTPSESAVSNGPPTNLKLHFRWPAPAPLAKRSRITPSELMLVLLKAGPVAGKTMMQKQMFLAYNEVFDRQFVMDPEFRPDYFGPYSPLVADIPIALSNQGKVIIQAKGEGHRTYVLGRRAREDIELLLRKRAVRSRMDRLVERKRSWDEFTTIGMLRYVYRNYPRFTTKTRVPFLRWE